jgi:leucine-zipper-like transcriptional regulator 1
MNMVSILPPPPPESVKFGETVSTSKFGWARVEVLDEGRIPCQRSLHAAAVWNDSMYVFGGYDGHSRVNDMYEYNFQLRRWRNTPPGMVTPSPRDRHAAVVYKNSFYIFGGFDGASRVNDFWQYNFETQGWNSVPVASGDPPTPRHSHMAVTHKNSMYVFGGYDGVYRADFYEYNFEKEQWRAVPTTGRLPRCRYRASCVVHKDTMIMFGGHDGTRHLNDTCIYNFVTGVWNQIDVTRSTPSPRDSHVAVVYGDSMFVFGGSTGEATDDFYELRIGKFRSSWIKVGQKILTSRDDWDYEDGDGDLESTSKINNMYVDSSSIDISSHTYDHFPLPPDENNLLENGNNLPGRRFCHVGQVFNDSLYIFGGYDGSHRLNDFIRYRFGSPNAVLKISPSTLLADIKAMVNNSELSDVTFVVDGGVRVYAHKFMLSRCPYFRAMLLGDMQEGQSEVCEIPMIDIDESVLLAILEYLYTDQIEISEASIERIMEIFQAADRFGITRLKCICADKMHRSLRVENAASILFAADLYNANELREKCVAFILMHFAEVTKTQAFDEMARTNIDLFLEITKLLR